jgi:hypothetical protein
VLIGILDRNIPKWQIKKIFCMALFEKWLIVNFIINSSFSADFFPCSIKKNHFRENENWPKLVEN